MKQCTRFGNNGCYFMFEIMDKIMQGQVLCGCVLLAACLKVGVHSVGGLWVARGMNRVDCFFDVGFKLHHCCVN